MRACGQRNGGKKEKGMAQAAPQRESAGVLGPLSSGFYLCLVDGNLKGGFGRGFQ